MKKESTIQENIFANDILDRSLISKIYKELTRLYSRKTNNPIKKWGKDLNRPFSKEELQKAQRHMKGCSASLAIREMEIKTTVRHHCTPVRMASRNKSTSSADEVVEIWDPRTLSVGIQTGEATVENCMEFPQKIEDGTAF